MQQEALFRQHIGAEVKEAQRDLGIAAEIQRVRDQRAIARPQIAVGVAVELRHIAVVGGDDRAVVVDLGAQDQERAAIQIDQSAGQIGKVERLFAHPQPPVRSRALDKRGRAALDELLLSSIAPFQRPAHTVAATIQK